MNRNQSLEGLAKPYAIAVAATKQMVNQHDLALAYSPGVAAPCEEIVKDPNNAFKYTSRGNLVGVVTNGTAVLGLGNIGALAGKPVMEGKGVLFQKFAGIDVFDIEINERDPDKLVDIIASLASGETAPDADAKALVRRLPARPASCPGWSGGCRPAATRCCRSSPRCPATTRRRAAPCCWRGWMANWRAAARCGPSTTWTTPMRRR